MARQKKCSPKKRQKTCCKELSEALQYKNTSFSFIQNKLIALHIGDVLRSPKENFRLMGKILKAIIPGSELPVPPPHFRLSNKLTTYPVSVPIRFCPFCGKQIRKDLLVNWAKDRKFKNKIKKGVDNGK